MHVEGTKQLTARLEAVQDSPRVMMRQLGLLAVREQKLLVARKTGHTGRTIRLNRATSDYAETVVEGAGAFLEYGTKPHIIRPKRARVLAFPAKGTPRRLSGKARKGGALAFAKVVHHPGTKPQPFMVPGARKALEAFKFAVRIIDAWNKAA